MASANTHKVYVGVGSNVGDRKGNFLEALNRLAELPDTKIIKESSLYESEPLGDARIGTSTARLKSKPASNPICF